ncbi:MAG: hypothetical protein IPG78_09265 [Ignavibacteria bacterium]|nr:hypothetical protein [Ignavibacteria bacterium]
MNSNIQKDFIVYVLSNNRKKTITGIMENVPEYNFDRKIKYKALVYFSRHTDRKKAVRKMSSILKMDNKDRIMFVKKNNPEWLDLIHTLNEY